MDKSSPSTSVTRVQFAVSCGLSLLLVLAAFPEGCSPVFLPPYKPTLLNCNSIWAIKHLKTEAERPLPSPTLNKRIYLFIIIIIIIITCTIHVAGLPMRQCRLGCAPLVSSAHAVRNNLKP